MDKKDNQGFSLIELVIAVAILAILSGILAPQLIKYIERSREARDMQVIDALYVAVNSALSDENAYEDFIQSSASGGRLENLTREDGMLAEDLLDEEGAFGEELRDILNMKDIELKSRRAAGTNSGSESGKIRIRIRDDDVAVWAAGAASEDKEDFTVGR